MTTTKSRGLSNEEFHNQLIEVGENRARQFNFGFTPGGQQEFRNFIERGVSWISSEDLQNQNIIATAENSVIRFVDEMIKNSEERRLNGVLDSGTVTNARMSLCPLWPIC